MKRIKGCINPKCSAHKASTAFTEEARYCTQCKSELSFICKKCKTAIPATPVQNLCIRCEADRQDRISKGIETAKKVVLPVVGCVGAAVVSVVKLFRPGSKS